LAQSVHPNSASQCPLSGGGLNRSTRQSGRFSDHMQCSLLPSRPGEFHPEPLTDPDLILSHHPARATARRLPPSIEHWVPPAAGWTRHRLTRFNVDGLLPSLHGHYPASPLLQSSPPLAGASVFQPRGWSHLCFFPWHRRLGSHVPYQSLIELRAAYMPDAA
jgi:hypothetical protein